MYIRFILITKIVFKGILFLMTNLRRLTLQRYMTVDQTTVVEFVETIQFIVFY